MLFYKKNTVKVLVFTLFSTISIFAEIINLDEKATRDWPFNLEEVMIDENLLGTGSFKNVYKTIWENKPAVLAIYNSSKKDFDPSLIENAFDNELKFYKNYQHENIIKAFAYSNDHRFVVLEYAENDLIKKFKGLEADFSKEKLKYFLDVSRGIKFLHANNIIHRDIKPANVVLIKNEDAIRANKYIAKIVDFDNYLILPGKDSSVNLEKSFGSTGYKAPEIMLRGSDKLYHYSFSSDIYALGVLFFNVLLKTRIFDKIVRVLEKISKKKVNKKIFDQNSKYKFMIYRSIFENYETILNQIFKIYIKPNIKDSYDDITKKFMMLNKEIFGLIKSMLAKKPEERPNIDFIVESMEGFIKKYKSLFQEN